MVERQLQKPQVQKSRMEDETYDYGLDPGESFDPYEDEEVDRSQPHIMTVLGPIHPAALGPANLAASFVPRGEQDDIGAILTEIQECAAVGLHALVDLRPIRNRREAEAALWLAQRSDLHLIVAAAGDSAQLIEAASVGLHGTSVLPGLIVVDPSDAAVASGLSGSEATGLPLLIDTRLSPPDSFVASERAATAIRPSESWIGIPPGARILFDLAGEPPARWPIPPAKPGFSESPWLVGYDPADKGKALFSRWSWLIEEFPILLLESGFELPDVQNLLIEAPADFLTIELPAPTRC